jgi:hypothetical protein
MKNQKYIVILLLIILIALIIQVGITYTEGNKGRGISFRQKCDITEDPNVPLKKWSITTEFSKEHLADKTLTRDFEWQVWENNADEYNKVAKQMDLYETDPSIVHYSGEWQYLFVFIIRFHEGRYKILLASHKQTFKKKKNPNTNVYDYVNIGPNWREHKYIDLPKDVNPPYNFEVWGYDDRFEFYNVGSGLTKQLMATYKNPYNTLCYFKTYHKNYKSNEITTI